MNLFDVHMEMKQTLTAPVSMVSISKPFEVTGFDLTRT